MAGSTISGTITATVTLGSPSYPSPLTITSTGDVAVTAFSAIGVYGPAGSGTITNDGTVTGGAGTSTGSGPFGDGSGGAGFFLLSGNTATNNGVISGGSGGSGGEVGGSGGAGVYLGSGAAFTNQATISGGAGGIASDYRPILSTNGSGGTGVVLDGGTLGNSGTIIGGYATGGNAATSPAYGGGTGVVLLAGTLSNSGMIAGGQAGDFARGGGDGVDLAAAATLLNSGTIAGGTGLEFGSVGVSLAAGATFVITGLVIGGAGGLEGSAGVELPDGGSLDNTGTVIGGGGGVGGAGVELGRGGTLTNAATIIGGQAVFSSTDGQPTGGNGVQLSNGGVLINTAFIAGGASNGGDDGGAGGNGVYIDRAGMVTNAADAIITGGAGGYASGTPQFGGGAGAFLRDSSLTNAGTIIGGTGIGTLSSVYGGYGGAGVSLTAGAMLTNTGSIDGGLSGHLRFGGSGGSGAVLASNTIASTLVNFGIIRGSNAEDLASGGTVGAINGPIAGGAGAIIGAGNTLINTGTILGGAGVYVGSNGVLYAGQITGGDGVTLASSGTLINSGVVVSGVGVSLAAGGTLNSYATISGGVYGGVTADAVLFAGAGELAIEGGAGFVGQVVGNASAGDALYLGANGSGAGTLSGIGTQFVNFAQITVGTDAAWTLTGANTIASGVTLTELTGAALTDTGTLVNNGAIVLDPSALTVAALTGTGSVAIDAGSSLEVQGAVAAGETLVFGGSGAYLHLDSPDEVAGSITNFTVGETIDLQGIDPTSVHYASGQLLFSGGGDIPLALANGGTVFASASSDGAAVTVLLCFCANTLILTPSGERPVQQLTVGDLVTTHRGKARPIEWIGNGKVLATRGRRNAATPVIVRKNALADNVPHRDLRVTKAHALWFDGVLIPVEYLVNHRLIEWDDRAQEVELYHIELASHDVLIANGAPAESYRDDGNRWLFRNANSGWDRPPQPPCAPVLTGGPVVDAVWRRLLERAGPRPGLPLTDDPDLHLLVDGVRLDARGRHGTAYVFDLPARADSVRIVSRAGVPAELGVARDPRLLGVALRRIVLRQGARFRVVEAADAALADGFHPFEPVNGLRWTDGDAALPAALFEAFDWPTELVLHVGATTRYPDLGVTDRSNAA